MLRLLGVRLRPKLDIGSSKRFLSNSKVVDSVEKALEGIKSNIILLSGGFGLCGLPETLIEGLLSKKDVQNITAVSNNAGIDGRGLSKLLESGQITKMFSSYIGNNKTFEKMYLSGKISLELCPQGNLAERCRAGGSGIPAFYTATGVGTWLEEGKLPLKYDDKGNVLETTKPREARIFNGKKYLLEEAIIGDVAFVKAYKADHLGNCWFRGSARNFNSVFARAGKLTIVEAEEIVQPGEIKPEDVHLPGIYVDKVIKSTSPKDIEILTVRKGESEKSTQLSEADQRRIRIVKRAAQEFENGSFVNLGIGMPTLAPGYVSEEVDVCLQSENGLLGLGDYPEPGKEDADFINAGKETVTLKDGGSLFGSEESFAMIRSGKINLTILGGFQVSQYGDLANWGLPGRIKGMGGAMDLVSNPSKTKVVVLMEHVDKKQRPKILTECSFPLTGARCVSKIITDLAVFEVDPKKGLTLTEISKDTTLADLRLLTAADFEIATDLKEIEL
ncbi:uncharacterized protein PRCAT00000022001 [Priceomyces carsonii]|uniref:uncharacterized protein n=1 Tax=Priceomyces carsonii TaxID=28549 RepID=UPI002EDAF13A|nr:unnamed protein product [Priceomyces carsonii]